MQLSKSIWEEARIVKSGYTTKQELGGGILPRWWLGRARRQTSPASKVRQAFCAAGPSLAPF
ncbi:hypothetical protein Mesau_02842 [Mesorhizobium australicum WSM2073]|uniref:Uncharacterized protein n=1 Tax=Mesorhizobium australicum (strain HAMBI 3006 / LMG 24608 / WSM2073) TaxID=754035 RepID=L0KMK2_MESAW|nr:hypothetical protein Mesau_02842 [Mesorhizobium australicum WSM2073]